MGWFVLVFYIMKTFYEQAGLAVIHEIFHVKDIVEDPEKVSRILAEQTPSWEPGRSSNHIMFQY